MSYTPHEPEPRTGDITSEPFGAEPVRSAEAGWPPAEVPAAYPSDSTVQPGAGATTSSTTDSTADKAKQGAADVKDTAVEAGKDVAATAKSEASKVAGETKQQAKSLFSSVTDEVSAQAGSQQQRIASSVGSLSKELAGMASGSSESGPLTDLAHQAARRGDEIASWLNDHEPRDVLRQVQSFARRRPLAFLVLCGAAGVLAGRITRGAVAANTEVDSPRHEQFADTQRALPTTTTPYTSTSASYSTTAPLDPYDAAPVPGPAVAEDLSARPGGTL